MTSYLDASCLLRRLIGDGPVLEPSGLWEAAVVSEIAMVEVARTLARVESQRRLTGVRLRDALEAWDRLRAGLDWVPVTPDVLSRASGPLPTVVRALDAIHLVSAELVKVRGEPGLVFATHDRQLATAATALGFEVAGV